MTFPSLTRPVVLTFGALALILALVLTLPFLSPQRGVERTWDHVLDAIADKDIAALDSLLGPDFSGGFGLDRAATLRMAGEIRGQFAVCNIRRERSEVVLDPSGKSATTRALVRLTGQGSPAAQAAIRASAATQVPTTFRWRRNSWKPWDWRLVAMENTEAARALELFQRQASAIGLSF